eukprot:1160382-Pelagomonas_calceolata.AAC.19
MRACPASLKHPQIAAHMTQHTPGHNFMPNLSLCSRLESIIPSEGHLGMALLLADGEARLNGSQAATVPGSERKQLALNVL